jgi:hypothetical protein
MYPILDEEPTCCKRLEDSYSFPENQKKYPDDEFMMEHEKKIIEKWHKKNISEEIEKLVK